MLRALEAIMRFAFRERLLQRFEQEVEKIETPLCNMYMKKGIEYIVRGKTSKNMGGLRLSLKTAAGTVVPTFPYNSGFTLIADKDCICQIWANIRNAGKNRPAGRVIITVSCSLPLRNIPFAGQYSSLIKEVIHEPVPHEADENTDGDQLLENASSGHLTR